MEVAAGIVEWARQTGNPIPELSDVLDSTPWDMNLPYWHAFHRLSNGRQIHGGMQPGYQRLVYDTVRGYGVDFGFGESLEDLEEFLTAIYAMDTVYLKHHADKADQQRKQRDTSGKGTKRK